jgi:hypothetical protein
MGSKVRAAFHGSTAYDAMRRQIALVESDPLMLWLSTEGPDAVGLFDPVGPVVDDAEREGARLIGALPCSTPHGAGGTFPHEVELTPVRVGPCPGCGAAL